MIVPVPNGKLSHASGIAITVILYTKLKVPMRT